MAKQFGVSDEALEGLKDPDRHPFPPEERAALRFAGAMTEGGGRVPDPIFEDLRRHFSEPQIVEIAAVAGLFNYFNRFNTALHVEITLTDPDVLVHRIEQAAAGAPDATALCDRTAEILVQGRRYSSVGIYALEGGRLARRAQHGDAPGSQEMSLEEVEAGAGTVPFRPSGRGAGAPGIFPVRSGGAIVGALRVASGRPAGFDEEDLDLLERVAAFLGRSLRP